MDICDSCEDSYLFDLAAKEEEVSAGIQVNNDLEKMLNDSEKQANEKAEQTLARLQAKELKYSKLSSQKEQGAAEVWEKAAEAHNVE